MTFRALPSCTQLSAVECMDLMTKPSGKNARIDEGIYEQLAEYSKETGVPVSKCIREALERWLTTVAPARLKALDRLERAAQPGQFQTRVVK